MQTQACQQVMDEADKEHKKISDRINEGREAMKASYAEFIAEAQASASRQPFRDVINHSLMYLKLVNYSGSYKNSFDWFGKSFVRDLSAEKLKFLLICGF
ncbi:hypothetical protein ACS0TY_011791 [Phlomoides rotata]